MPNGQHLYRFVDWPGTVGKGNFSGVGSSNGDWISQSQGVSHLQPGTGSIEVTSHFGGDYEELRIWAPVNMCLFEAGKTTHRPEEHEHLVGKMQTDIWDTKNPWKRTTGEVDGETAEFEAVTVGNSFAAITQLPGNVVTIVSRGVPLPDLRLVKLPSSPPS